MFVNIEQFEKRFVHQPPHLVGCARVHGGRVVEQEQGRLEKAHADAQLCAGVAKPLIDPALFERDLVESLSNLARSQGSVCRQVDETLLLDVERLTLLQERLVDRARSGLLICDDVLHERPKLRHEIASETELVVTLGDSPLNVGDGQVRQIANTLLAAPAQEVLVPLLVSAPRFGVDQTRLSAELMAAIAEQLALKVVKQHAITLSLGAPRKTYVLHPIEERLAHNRFMATG